MNTRFVSKTQARRTRRMRLAPTCLMLLSVTFFLRSDLAVLDVLGLGRESHQPRRESACIAFACRMSGVIARGIGKSGILIHSVAAAQLFGADADPAAVKKCGAGGRQRTEKQTQGAAGRNRPQGHLSDSSRLHDRESIHVSDQKTSLSNSVLPSIPVYRSHRDALSKGAADYTR